MNLERTITPLAVGFVSHRIRLDGARARSLYRWLIGRTEQIGIAPDIVTLDAPGFWGSKYKSFKRVRARVDQFDFSTLRWLGLTRQRPDWSDRNQNNWISTASISWNRNQEILNSTQWLIGPVDAGLSEQNAAEHLIAYAKLSVDHYGYVFSMPREYRPEHHSLGRSGNEPFAVADERENAGWWGLYQELIPSQLMLRDIYQTNFLAGDFLSLPVYGTTLEQWIRQNEQRGTLTPLTSTIWQWTPLPANISIIREALFRAGILFYYKFFQHWEPDNTWKRDFSKRFVPHEPIPEIFQSRYRRITDPQN